MNCPSEKNSLPRRNLFGQFVSRLLIPLLLAFFLATTGTAMIGHNLKHQEVVAIRNQTMQTFTASLVKPLWDCDNTTAQGILEALAYQSGVLSATLEESCQGQKLVADRGLDHQAARVTENSRITYKDERNREFNLGTLTVEFSQPSKISATLEVLWQYLVLFAILMGVMLIGALIVFRRTILMPLSRFQKVINTSSESNRSKSLMLEEEMQKRNDELGDVMQSFDDLMLKLASVIEQLRNNEAALKETARKDPLTGLGNRLVMDEEFTKVLARSQRSGQSGCVVLLDLDGFKPINDTFGHEAGDVILQQTAQRIKAVMRATDTVIRLGGDEFVVIAEGLSENGAIINMVDKLTEIVADTIHYKEHSLHVGVSIGVAIFPEDGVCSTALLAKADREMYAVKRNRKGQS